MPGYRAVRHGDKAQAATEAPQDKEEGQEEGQEEGGRHVWLGQLALCYVAYLLRLAGSSWPKGLASGCCDLGVHVAAPSLLSGLACWPQNRDEPSWADATWKL